MFIHIWGVLWRLMAIATAIYVGWRVRFIVVIVLLSVILTYVAHPLVERGCRWRPRAIRHSSWRFLVTLGVFLTLIALSVALMLWIWVPFQAQLNDLHQSIGDYQTAIEARLAGLREWYDRLPESMRAALDQQPDERVTHYLLGLVGGILARTVDWAARIWELILIPVLAFYFCLDSRSLKRELLYLVPYRKVRETLFLLRQATRIMQSYVVAQLVLCLVAGVVVGGGPWILKVPYPLVLGVLAGITRAVPIVGPVIGAIPITLLAMTVSLKMGMSVLLFFCILHLVESKVLLPELVGHRMKLHPAIILIVLLVGAEFYGILGMFLAAPVAAILRMLLGFYLIEPEMRRRRALGGMATGRLAPEEANDLFRKVS